MGLWHQGTVAAACFADLGYEVIAADADKEKIRELNEGKAPLFEPGLNELIKKNISSGRLKFSDDIPNSIKGIKNILIMLDIPVDENDKSNLTEFFKTCEEIAPNLEDDSTVVVTAQVPVGTCEKISEIIKARNSNAKIGIAYVPENLRLGQAINLFPNPALPVIGSDNKKTSENVEEIFSILGKKWEKTSLRTAEMVKHALNAFIGSSIVFGNELGNLCDAVGADGKKLAELLRLEPRIGQKAMIFPGLAFSGGTLARDIQTLRETGKKHNVETRFFDGVWESNKSQNKIIIKKLGRIFGSLKGLNIAVLGLTYKPDTSTLRRSAALEIISDMVSNGINVKAHDPKADRNEIANHPEFEFFDDTYECIKNASALIIITGWKEYKNLDFVKIRDNMAIPKIIDVNNFLDEDKLKEIGFDYYGVGRGK